MLPDPDSHTLTEDLGRMRREGGCSRAGERYGYRWWKKQLLKADTCLINVASNFIYIPYEAYSIKEIAIPAFQMVSDEGLKVKYKSRYEMLLKYKEHVVEFISCLTEMKKVLSNPFAKDANDAIKVLKTNLQTLFRFLICACLVAVCRCKSSITLLKSSAVIP